MSESKGSSLASGSSLITSSPVFVRYTSGSYHVAFTKTIICPEAVVGLSGSKAIPTTGPAEVARIACPDVDDVVK